MQSAELEKTRQQWVSYVAKKLAKDVTEIEIVNDLITKGFEKQQAQEFVRYVYTHELKAMSKAGKLQAPILIVIGLILIGVGVTVTISGVGIIWYGIIIVGISFVARGVYKLFW